VITELVINHTSDQHPWFQRARMSPPGSVERDYYVWSETDEKYGETRIIFIDTEKSNWTWDAEAKAYFWHRFYSHQPDLNFDNPKVMEEVLDVMHLWLDMGIDGLRLDAIPYLIEREGTNCENLPETHVVLKRIRAEIDEHYQGRCCWRSEPVARGHPPLLRGGRRVPHELPLPAHAAHVHGDRAGGPAPDHGHHAADPGHPGELPVGRVPAQPRRAHARDGDRQRA
jgi:maltose alpha-D-glucosyltransferase/alpha-amylase